MTTVLRYMTLSKPVTLKSLGEEISLFVVPINDPNGTQELYLEVVSRGPLGIGYVSCGNSFRHAAKEAISAGWSAPTKPIEESCLVTGLR